MVVNRLAELLRCRPPTFARSSTTRGSRPTRRCRSRSTFPYVLAYVSEHREDFPGVRAEPLAIRRYVNGQVAAHVLGYVGEINQAELTAQPKSAHYELGDTIGKGGVELTYESDLRGTAGTDRVEVDSTGRVLRTISTKRPQPGHDVKLTIDLDVQKLAEDSLAQGIVSAQNTQDKSYKQGFKKLAAPAGSVVVLDATNGSVVAMASNPTYDPNSFSNGIPTPTWQWLNDPAHHYPLVDRAIAGQYAPGSTFKLITAIAGLHSGDITANKTIDDKGKYAYPTDPKQLLQQRQRRPVRPGRSAPRAHRVERRVLLHDRWRPLLPSAARDPRRRRAPGHGPRIRLRQGHGHRAAQRSERVACRTPPGSRRSTTANPGRVPVSGLAAGRQHPLGRRPGRHARHPAAARERLRDVRERRHAARAPARVRGARREREEDP